MWGGGFVNRIKEARKRAGMKQADLCALLGVSQGALSGWENGRFDPGASVWLRLAQILGVSLEYLMGGEAPEGAAPASAPRAPLLPGQEPEAADDEDTLSGLVAKPAAPGAGIAWQRRHKAIRAIQALRRLYR